MIHTSYFSKYRGNAGCSIALYPPKGFKGATCDALYPPKSLMEWYKAWEQRYKEELEQTGNHEVYKQSMKMLKKSYAEQYKGEILDRIDPASVAKALDGKVLLCYEKSGAFCHRNIVRHWLQSHGYVCEELVYRREVKGVSARQKRKVK